MLSQKFTGRCVLLKLLFSCFIFATGPGSYAQHGNRGYLDSLEQQLDKKLSNADRADVLFMLSKYWADVADTTKAIQYLQQALVYNPDDDFHKAKANFYEGNIYLNHNIIKAQELYLKCDELLKDMENPDARRLLARAWNNYAVGCQMKGDNNTFVEIITEKVIPVRMNLKDSNMLGIDYLNIGGAMSNILNYEKAIKYYKEAVVYLKQGNACNEDLIEAFSSVAANHLYLYQNIEAMPYIDSAAIVVAQHPGSSLSPIYYRVAATYYNRLKAWDAALRMAERGIAAARELHQPYYELQLRFELSKTMMGKKIFSAARNELMAIYKDTTAMMRVENRQMVLLGLAQADSALQRTGEAYSWLRQYAILSDSIATTDHRMGVERLELKFQTAEKEKKILALQNEQQQNRFILITLSIVVLVCLLLLIIGWLFYRNRQKFARQERQLQQEILKAIQHTSQLEIYQAMLNGQEEERSRLARDLHDGLGGTLASVKLKLAAITGSRGDGGYDINKEMQDMISRLDQSVTELRRIAHNLMPLALLELGLEPALRNLCNSFVNEKLQVDTAFLGLEAPVSQTVQTAVYRIVQELLNNVRKHAKAATVLVQCTRNNDHILITVEDDGIGIDSHRPKGDGIGLINISKRVDYLNGTFEMHSGSGQGTTVNIEIRANGKDNQSHYRR